MSDPVIERFETDDAWRVAAVIGGNSSAFPDLLNPWLHLEFVNPLEPGEAGMGDRIYKVVGIDESDRLDEQQAHERRALFAASCLRDVIMVFPPDGIQDFRRAFLRVQSRVVVGEVLASRLVDED